MRAMPISASNIKNQLKIAKMADPLTLLERTARIIVDTAPKISQFLEVQCSNKVKITTS